jgi:hypothetical protein
MCAIFDAPVVADSGAGHLGAQFDLAGVIGCFGGFGPKA